MASQVSTFTTFAEVARGGAAGGTWANPGNAQTSDNSNASIVPTIAGGTVYTDWLQCTELTTEIPAGATVEGFIVTIERKRTGSNNARDSALHMVRGGTIQTGEDDKADTGTNWPTSDGSVTYGGSGDMWGGSFTDTQVNASDFGVALSISHLQAFEANVTAFIDQIKIEVFYAESSSGALLLPLIGIG